MAGHEAQNSNASVTNTLFVIDYLVYLLFDSELTHSFIISYFTKHAGLAVYPLEKLLELSSPLGRRLSLIQ